MPEAATEARSLRQRLRESQSTTLEAQGQNEGYGRCGRSSRSPKSQYQGRSERHYRYDTSFQKSRFTIIEAGREVSPCEHSFRSPKSQYQRQSEWDCRYDTSFKHLALQQQRRGERTATTTIGVLNPQLHSGTVHFKQNRTDAITPPEAKERIAALDKQSADDQLNYARHAFSRVRDSQRALIKCVSTITFLLMILGQKAKPLETRNSLLSNRITALESEKEWLYTKHSDDIHSINERLNAASADSQSVNADSQWVRVQVKKWRATYQFKRELPSVPFLTPKELKVADARKATREGLQKKIQSLKQELSNSTEQQSALKRDNESKDQKLAELNNEITTKDEQLKALKDEKQNATSSMESLEKTIKYKNKRMVELTEELQQKNNELEETKSDMESFEEDLNSISKT
ncbi:MAG: hypothetical protein M1831_000809, partial [Alyxoria varia]